MSRLEIKLKRINKHKEIFDGRHRSSLRHPEVPSQRYISGDQKNPYLSFQQNYLPPSHCTASIHRYISAVNSSSRR